MGWEKGGENYENALAEVLAGKSIKRAAQKYGINNWYLNMYIRSKGYYGTKYRRNAGAAIKILDQYIHKDSAGHWLWKGPADLGSHPIAPNKPRNVARFLVGLPECSNPIHQRSRCGVVSCINPAHSYGERLRSVKTEVIKAWIASEEAKKRVVTIEDLARKYDLPRSAISYMIRKTGKFRK